jgi:hypothetical protein
VAFGQGLNIEAPVIDPTEMHQKLFSDPSEAALAHDAVGFDGRFYRYADYRYDRRSDAVDYARLDLARPTPVAAARTARTWPVCAPTFPQEPGLLEALAVTHDGRYFRYGTYRYDRWQDAVAYAQLKGVNGGRHPML